MSTPELPQIYSFHFLWLYLKWLSLEKVLESNFPTKNKMKLDFATFDMKGVTLFWLCLHSHLQISWQIKTLALWHFKGIFSRFVSFPLLCCPSFLISPLPPLLSPYLPAIIIERYFAINMSPWDKRSWDPKHCVLPMWLVLSVLFSRPDNSRVYLIQWYCFCLVNGCLDRSRCFLWQFSVMWIWS